MSWIRFEKIIQILLVILKIVIAALRALGVDVDDADTVDLDIENEASAS